MKYISLAVVIGALTMASGATQAACVKVLAPTLPDGETAVLEDMVAGQKAVKEYLAGGVEYLACLDKVTAAAAAEEDSAVKAARIEDYNGVVAEQEAVAADFNSAIKAFKARQ